VYKYLKAQWKQLDWKSLQGKSK